jgi:hypothetical protein
MPFTLVPVNLLNGAGVSTPFGAFNDGTNSYLAHPLVDNTGAIIAPATSTNQATEITALQAIQAAVTSSLPAGTAIVGKFTTDQTAHGTTDLVAADITKVGGVSFALGQQLASASMPVVMTAAQITALTSPVLGAGTNSVGTVGINSGTNSIGTVGLNAGGNTIGNVGLVAGSAIAGKFGIDQTTPGTTNGVQVNAALPAGSNVIGGVTAADGAVATIGAKADSAVTSPGSSGSLIALVKGLLTGINTLITGTVLAAGTAIVGKVGIDQTTPGTTNGVQVNAALPAGTNTIGAVSAGVNVIAGNTLTRPANTTAYAFGQLIANTTSSGITVPTIAAARGTNVPTAAVRCRLQKTNTSTTNAIYRVHFWNAAPTVTNGDGGAFVPTFANYCGSFDVTCNLAGSDFAFGIGGPTLGSSMAFIPASGTSNLYYLIEARAAYTPVSGEIFTPYLEIQ